MTYADPHTERHHGQEPPQAAAPAAVLPPRRAQEPTSSARTATSPNPAWQTGEPIVLVVDDVPDNLSMLHDALDAAGYAVIVATSGAAALKRAAQVQPDIVLLDAMMPGMDGFELARRLKSEPLTAHVPIVFMTGLTDTEHVVAAFAAGGVDYVTKPIRPPEVLARMASHLAQARVQRQARNALDAFGHATLAVHEPRGLSVWQTSLARSLLHEFFELPPGSERLPAELQAWVAREALRRRAGAEPAALTIARGARKLTCALHGVDPAALGDDHWLVVLRMSDDTAMVDALMRTMELTAREAEVLYWVTKGKTNRDIGDILGTSPRTVHKHLEHVFQKLGVETRTAAAALALSKVAALA